MIIDLKEFINNLDHYLKLAGKMDIIVAENGRPLAKLPGSKQHVVEQAEDYLGKGPVSSYQEYLELTKNSDERYELINGNIYLLTSPKIPHQYAQTEVFGQLYSWFKGKNCTVFVAPNDIKLTTGPDNINVVQPDIMVVCDLEENLGDDGYYHGVPALVVEIVSQSSQTKDMVHKLKLYMSSGVQEYWVINPLNQEVTLYQFRDKDISRSRTFSLKDERATSFIFQSLSILALYSGRHSKGLKKPMTQGLTRHEPENVL